MEADDAAVVARARGGDPGAFRDLVESHSRHLFHLAYRITGNESDAEDVVQETFLKAYRALPRFEPRANLGTWLRRIAANQALDVMRARRRQGLRAHGSGSAEDPTGSADPLDSLREKGPSPDRLLLSSEVALRVRRAMSLLSPNERAAFVLRHFEDMSNEEIGRALGLRENAAKQSVLRAVRKLRKVLEPVAGPARC